MNFNKTSKILCKAGCTQENFFFNKSFSNISEKTV